MLAYLKGCKLGSSDGISDEICCPEGKAELAAGTTRCVLLKPSWGSVWMVYFGIQNLAQSSMLFKSSVLSLRVPTLLLAAGAVLSDRHAVEQDGRMAGWQAADPHYRL